MLGTIVNSLAIIAGTIVGLLFRNGIPERYSNTIIQGAALSVMLVGMKSALGSEDLLIIIISMAVGALIGEMIGIEAYLKKMGDWLESRFAAPESNKPSLSAAFVTSSLLFCVGSMAIVGSLESGLTGNHATLFAKSCLDGIISIVLTASLGIGVILSAVSVLLYQGAITLAAGLMKPLLVPAVVAQMSATGGLLIMGIGMNMLREKQIAVGNMLPAIFLPLVYHLVRSFFKSYAHGDPAGGHPFKKVDKSVGERQARVPNINPPVCPDLQIWLPEAKNIKIRVPAWPLISTKFWRF